MTDGSSPRQISSTINVTPLIDVLLVLLIIFMVVVPVTPRGQAASLPRPAASAELTSPSTIVVSVLATGGKQIRYEINQNRVAPADLLSRLTAIYQNRAERTLFIRGDEDVNFSAIAQVIDIGRSAGADRVGLITPKSRGL